MTRKGLLSLLATGLCACGGGAAGNIELDPGQRMYRDGLLVSGEPMTALVGGDIPITGTQFSCENCHGRSGMGAAEGPYVVPPVAGQFLFAASPQPERPAYDRDSLARLLRDGVTPSGRALAPELMPRYRMGDDDVAALAAFLEGLSSVNSPGVDDAAIRFATIVTDGAEAEKAAAIRAVLQRFAEDINSQTRNESGRWDRGYTPESKLPTVFREWVIDEWMLRGERDTWPQQLEQYYRDAPVFAVISGTGKGSWLPVSEFCEANKVACLYPSTDLPHRRDDDFYTLYFSQGLLLEAELIAVQLREEAVSNVVQVYCDADLEAVVTTLRDKLPDVPGSEISFDCKEPIPFEALEALSSADSAVVLWLDAEKLKGVDRPIEAASLYLSSTLTGTAPPASLASAAEIFMAHPYRLPGKMDVGMRRFEFWANNRGVAITAPRQQAEAYFACLVLKDAVKHMGRFFIREFALDMLDHAEGLSAFVPVYERPSFGPGQRFVSKGGYLLPVVGERLATEDARWIIP